MSRAEPVHSRALCSRDVDLQGELVHAIGGVLADASS